MAGVDAEEGCEIRLYLSFEGLASRDLLSASDPFAEVSLLESGLRAQKALAVQSQGAPPASLARRQPSWRDLGATEHLQNQNTGSWAKSFDVRFIFEEEQKVRVRVFDFDRLKKHDFVGEAIFTLGSVMGSPGQRLKVRLAKSKDPGMKKNRGAIIVQAERQTVGADGVSKSSGGTFSLHLRAHKLDAKDWGGFGRSDPYFMLQRKIGGEWTTTFQSEVIKNTLNPVWKPQRLSWDKVVRGNPQEELRIRVFDYDEGTKHDHIGDVYTNAQQLLNESGKRSVLFDVVHPPTKRKYQKKSYKNSGQIEVILARYERPAIDTMLEYIAGGMQINLMVAIDFTASNGDPRDPRSLHHFNPHRFNAYQSAIIAVGNILQAYDSDGQIPVFGFGAKINGVVEHCFPLTGNPNNPEVHGIRGIMDAYQVTMSYAMLSGPTYFAPLLRVVNNLIHNPEMSQQAQSYNVLLLLTDGAVMDVQPTVDELVRGSELPLSIVIVGVGNADFSTMEYLDGDDLILKSSTGAKSTRDIVQFVPFNECRNDGALLAKKTLAEIPGQLVQFFTKLNIKPNPPLAAPSDLPESESLETASYPTMPASAPPPPSSLQQQNLANSGRQLLSQAYHL